jgi:hypothetical protein
MMYVNSSAINTDNTIESETQEILSKIDSLSAQNEVEKAELEISGPLAVIKGELEEALKDIEELLDSHEYAHNASELEALEKTIVGKTDRLAGLLIGYKVQQSVDSEELREEARKLIKACPKKLKNQGRREVTIHPLRGEEVLITCAYFSQKGKKDKRRQKKRRGVYPALVLLGLYDHYTPGLSSEISLIATISSSYEEAHQVLKERGYEIDVKSIRAISISYAQRARAALMVQESGFTESVSGRKVAVSTDGGRLRIRTNKKGGKTKKGRPHYRTDWREPKLLIIYVVETDGRVDRTFSPFIDGTLKGPDAIFWLLNYYLSRLNIGQSDKVLFVADGARWIWKRVGALMSFLEVGPGGYYELVDFYHAVEHLGKVANLQKGWKKSQRKRWVTKYRRLLLQGAITDVLEEIRRLCRGRRSKKLNTERDYFVRNQGRMNYAEIRQKGLPLGSGAMESAIRRVVNLKLKGASIYWLRENAEAMLLLRSYFKAGRWGMLKQLAFSALLPDIV